MGAKQILIANTDLRQLGEYGRALGQDCQVTLVTTSAEALNALSTTTVDVLVADEGLKEMSGAELLDLAHTDFPKTLRILLATPKDAKSAKTTDVEGSHLILAKPCDNAALNNAVHRALAINQWLASNSLRELVGRLRTFPIVPSLYIEVVNALKSPDATTADIGGIIAKDMAMMTKLLQVTNSACFGLPRKISDPVEAVGILGFETVKNMVMTLKLLSQYDKVKPVYFSIDRLWRHSTEVGRIARGIARSQSPDPALAETAFAAGLMHDVGKLILAANFDDQYSRAQDMARKRQIPLVEVEMEIFGASHGEIGAYLLGLWGMPLDLVETAALHHNPSKSLNKRFGALTAVHVANALSYEVNQDKQGFVPSTIDGEWLASLGLDGQVPHWRDTILMAEVANSDTSRSPSGNTVMYRKPAAAQASSQTIHITRPQKPKEEANPNPPIFANPTLKWLLGGLAGAAFVAIFWFGTQSLLNRSMPEDSAPIAQVAPAAPPKPAQLAPSPAPAAATRAPIAATPAPTTNAVATTTNSAPAQVAAAPEETLSPTEQAFSKLRLQTIFYSPNHPSAVINGRAVQTNDRLASGAVVVEIHPSSVVLEFDNERRTLALK